MQKSSGELQSFHSYHSKLRPPHRWIKLMQPQSCPCRAVSAEMRVWTQRKNGVKCTRGTWTCLHHEDPNSLAGKCQLGAVSLERCYRACKVFRRGTRGSIDLYQCALEVSIFLFASVFYLLFDFLLKWFHTDISCSMYVSFA